MRENFAPLAGSSFNGDDLVLPFDKDVVKDAPDIADSAHLDEDEQQRLYAYYSQYVSLGGFGASEPVAVRTSPVGQTSRPPAPILPQRATPEGPRAETRPARPRTTR